MDAVQTAYQGTVVSQIYEGDRVFDVSVVLDSAMRHRSRRTPRGSCWTHPHQAMPKRTRIPLRQLADVYETTGRYVVLHEATRRRQAVTSNVRGRDVASFVADARKRKLVNKFVFRREFILFFRAGRSPGGRAPRVLLTSAIAGVGIVLLRLIALGDFRNLVLVLANLPFALAGGVLAIFFSGRWR